MSMKPYKQTTYETCLPSCLISLCGLPANEENEIEIWKHGWKFDRYVVGQLGFVSEKFSKKFRLTIENQNYADYVRKFVSGNVEIVSEKIDISSLKKRLEKAPAIVYLDDFALHGLNHVPHFVLVTAFGENNNALIMDPYEGKYVKYPSKAITRGMTLLWNHIMNTRMIIELAE